MTRREDTEKNLADLQGEIDEIQSERRRRKDVLEKGRKRYQALLDSIGMTDEQVMELVDKKQLHPGAYDMLRKGRDEAARAGRPEEAQEPAPEAAPRKKRMKVKL